jgi:hypothetical protein
MVSLRVVFLLSVCMILGFLPGCQENPIPSDNSQTVVVHNSISGNVIVRDIPEYMKGHPGTGIGYARPEDVNTSDGRPQNYEFRLKEGEDFSLYLILINSGNTPRLYMISMILDFQQIEFRLDGKDGLLHKFTVSGNSETNIPLIVKVDGPGVHELVAVLFDEPDNLTTETKVAHSFRLDLYGHVSTRRTQIIIDDDMKPASTIPLLMTGTSISPDVKFKARVYFASSPTSENVHASNRQLYAGTGVAGKIYKFQMVCNNIEDKPAVYAFTSFLNFQQAEVSGQKNYYIYLNPNEEKIIDIEVLLPDEPQVNQFQVIWLFDPYKSVLNNEAYAPFVFGSPRIAIDTR